MSISELLSDRDREILDGGGYIERLDYGYIESSAEEVARALRRGRPVEIAFQPGDGTFYGLVFTPLGISPQLETAAPRVKDGLEWDRHACKGVGVGLDYGEGWALVSYVEHAACPFEILRGPGW